MPLRNWPRSQQALKESSKSLSDLRSPKMNVSKYHSMKRLRVLVYGRKIHCLIVPDWCHPAMIRPAERIPHLQLMMRMRWMWPCGSQEVRIVRNHLDPGASVRWVYIISVELRENIFSITANHGLKFSSLFP